MANSLNINVLVLNKLWQPIQTCSVRRAVKLLCLGHAQVVEAEGEMKYQTHDFGSWLEASAQSIAEEVVRSVNFARLPALVPVQTIHYREQRLQRFRQCVHHSGNRQKTPRYLLHQLQ